MVCNHERMQMQKTMAILVILVAAGVAQGQGDVKGFVDKIAAANPQGRWMPRGTIAFTLTESTSGSDGENSYTIIGSVRFNKDHALFERYLTAGSFPWKPQPDTGTDPTKSGISEDVLISVAPGTMTIHIPSIEHMRIYDGDMARVESFNMISGGVLHRRTLDGLIGGGSGVSGNRLTRHAPDGATLAITADPEGRLTEMSFEKGNHRRFNTYSRHVQVGDKWLPQDVTMMMASPGQTVVRSMTLEFEPDDPRDDELTISAPEGTSVRRVSLNDIPTNPPDSNRTSKRSEMGVDTTVKLYPAPHWEYYRLCDVISSGPPETWQHVCECWECTYEHRPCGTWDIYYSYHECRVFNLYNKCWATRFVYEDHWSCWCQLEWPEPPWCAGTDAPCYPNIDTYYAVISYNTCTAP